MHVRFKALEATVEMIEQFAWIGWLVLILIFLTVEALTLDFTFLMLGIGGVERG